MTDEQIRQEFEKKAGPLRTSAPVRELDRFGRGQSKRASAAEALLNILIGFWISVGANLLLLPLWGYQVSVAQGVEIGLAFTLVSFLRSYILRRLFNHFHVKGSP